MNETIQITTDDGYQLSAILYKPSVSNQKTVLINSAMAVQQTYYAKFATYLAEQGFTVLTYDYRGVGASRPPKLSGFKAGVLDWADRDQNAMHTWLSEHYPNYQRLMVGHSFGGQIAGITPQYPEIAGWLMVTTQSGYWRNWDGFLPQAKLFTLWHITLPALARVYGYIPGKFGLGNDIPADVGLEWAQACRSPQYFYDIFGGTAYDRFKGVTVPILSYSFTDDDYATRRSVEQWMAHFSNAPITRKHLAPSDLNVPKIGHFGFFRSQFEDSLWAESAAWLANR